MARSATADMHFLAASEVEDLPKPLPAAASRQRNGPVVADGVPGLRPPGPLRRLDPPTTRRGEVLWVRRRDLLRGRVGAAGEVGGVTRRGLVFGPTENCETRPLPRSGTCATTSPPLAGSITVTLNTCGHLLPGPGERVAHALDAGGQPARRGSRCRSTQGARRGARPALRRGHLGSDLRPRQDSNLRRTV